MGGIRSVLDRVLRQWMDGRSLAWTARNNPDRQVGVGVIRFRTPAGAQAYFGFAADLQRKQDEVMGKVSGGACRCPTAESRR